jgi:serine/threonine protein phosphatase PrpC
MSKGGQATPLSFDHKPQLPVERSRIERAGFEVDGDRVSGILAVARALGDWEYKDRNKSPEDCAVTCVPEIVKQEIT